MKSFKHFCLGPISSLAWELQISLYLHFIVSGDWFQMPFVKETNNFWQKKKKKGFCSVSHYYELHWMFLLWVLVVNTCKTLWSHCLFSLSGCQPNPCNFCLQFIFSDKWKQGRCWKLTCYTHCVEKDAGVQPASLGIDRIFMLFQLYPQQYSHSLACASSPCRCPCQVGCWRT